MRGIVGPINPNNFIPIATTLSNTRELICLCERFYTVPAGRMDLDGFVISRVLVALLRALCLFHLPFHICSAWYLILYYYA
jgi:hypothetical protein